MIEFETDRLLICDVRVSDADDLYQYMRLKPIGATCRSSPRQLSLSTLSSVVASRTNRRIRAPIIFWPLSTRLRTNWWGRRSCTFAAPVRGRARSDGASAPAARGMALRPRLAAQCSATASTSSVCTGSLRSAAWRIWRRAASWPSSECARKGAAGERARARRMVVFGAKLNSVDRVGRDDEGPIARPRRRPSAFESLLPPAHCCAEARQQPVRIMEDAAAVSDDALRPGIERIPPPPTPGEQSRSPLRIDLVRAIVGATKEPHTPRPATSKGEQRRGSNQSHRANSFRLERIRGRP